ncbi:MAG: hypothetical protein ACI8RD_013686, partial [Bacillariaceae sp.]
FPLRVRIGKIDFLPTALTLLEKNGRIGNTSIRFIIAHLEEIICFRKLYTVLTYFLLWYLALLWPYFYSNHAFDTFYYTQSSRWIISSIDSIVTTTTTTTKTTTTFLCRESSYIHIPFIDTTDTDVYTSHFDIRTRPRRGGGGGGI